ncbi:DUF2125 domain-containing protein [Caulobacter sp. RL271]|uniref:DUF2125 domain-containing protein n=1 Tax=Caulobacter segnis TaxID=88688 RepID=A0ABY4ZNE7_9CAUL|nr:DUF2125 domain-containing protein [Caulobacter segnis]USQ94328.1 DUF2125 domain-containing protein [Caulobacter segnis]
MTHNDAAPSRKAPQKARRGRLFTPFILAALVAGGWSYGWFWLRGQAEQRMDEQAADLKSRGYDLSWSDRTFHGFPFRMNVDLTDARVAEPTGWAVRAPVLKGEAEIFDLTHWVLVAEQGVVLTRPEAGDVTITGQALRASISHVSEYPPRVSVEGAKLTFVPAAGAKPFELLSAEDMQLHLRAGPDDQGAIFFKAGGAKTAFTGLLGRIAQDKTAAMILETRLSHVSYLRGRNWEAAVKRWSEAGGQITLQQSQILAGDAVGKAKSGVLSVDDKGRVTGSLNVVIKERPDLSKPIRTPEQAPAAAAQALGQDPEIEADLNFRNGRTLLGAFDTGPAPTVY